MMIAKSKEHLRSAGESWNEHRRFAWWYSRNCLIAAVMAFVHGFVPGWFPTGASERVKALADPDEIRHRK